MANAPLPPHERPWRHPSELGPSPASVEPSSGRSRFLAISSGAVTAVLVAVMVVSITPKRSGAPSAVSATTIAPASVQLRSVPAESAPVAEAATPLGAAALSVAAPVLADTVRIDRSSMSHDRGMALVGAPNGISTAPTADLSTLTSATATPADDDRVILLTSSFTYDVAWSDLADLVAPDGSIVMTRDGQLLATFVDDELRLLVD